MPSLEVRNGRGKVKNFISYCFLNCQEKNYYKVLSHTCWYSLIVANKVIIKDNKNIIYFVCIFIITNFHSLLLNFPKLPLCNLEALYKHISFYCILLYCISQILYFFLQTEDLWQPCIKQAYQLFFQQHLLMFSVSHFINPHNILNFHYHYIVIVICDLWCYYWNWYGAPGTMAI